MSVTGTEILRLSVRLNIVMFSLLSVLLTLCAGYELGLGVRLETSSLFGFV